MFAFAVSAGLLLSFFPFLTVTLSICRYVFKWKAGVAAVYFALDDYFPDAFGQFIRRNFEVTVASQGPVQIVSLVLLFFTASGIFLPLEVALNRVWNCPENRNYFKNQLISLGLIFACGALMLFSVTLTALNNEFLSPVIVPAAIVVGLLLEALKYINLATWPYLRTKLQSEYGPFYYTVTILLWGFVAALIVLAGAEWTARGSRTSSACQPRIST